MMNRSAFPIATHTWKKLTGLLPPSITRNGTAAQIANGVHLEVAGEARGGVVVARKVEFERDDEADKFELSGAIESIDAGTHTFVLRGVTVSYDDSTRFDGGTVAMLAVGARVEVSGKLSANGTQVLASRIEFKS